jgi:hypothetical protein
MAMAKKYFKDTELIKDISWERAEKNFESDVLVSCGIISKTKYGIKLHRITILDRMTGFGHRDIETGYRANDGQFWLASGYFDIRNFGDLTINDAITKIKENANNCTGGYIKNSFPANRVFETVATADSLPSPTTE